MKNSIFNAVCKTRYLALLVVLMFATSAWGAGIYIEYNSTKYYSGSTITIALSPHTLPAHGTTSMAVKNDAGWTQDSNDYYGQITTTLSGTPTPTNVSFLMGSYTASSGTPSGNANETSYTTYNSSASTWNASFQLGHYFTTTGNHNVTFTITETDTKTGSTLQTATITVRYTVSISNNYTVTYHLTGVEHRDNTNPIVTDGTTFYAYFNYADGYTGPLTVAKYADDFGCSTSSPCDMGNGTGDCYYEGSLLSDFQVRFNEEATGPIHIYLTATVDECAVPTFDSNTGVGFAYLLSSYKPTGLRVSGGKVTDKHSKTVTEYGWCFGTTNPPTVSSARRYYSGDVTEGTAWTGYGDITSGLTPGQKYYVRAYATVNCGTGYGPTYYVIMPYLITLDKNNSDAGSTNGTAYIVANATSFYSSASTTAPTRTGYDLEGYYSTPACVTKIATTARALQASVSVGANEWTDASNRWTRAANETFYAKWTPHTYTVRFNKNDGDATGTMENQAFTYGVAQNLTSCGFSKEGYMFVGWALDEDGEKWFDNGEEVSDLTATNGATFDLYAVWQAAPIAIHWMVNGVDWSLNPSAHGNPTIAVASGSKPTQLPTTPVAGDDGCGSKFMGWTTAPIDGSRGTAPNPCWNSLSCGTCFPAITAETWYYAVFADEQP